MKIAYNLIEEINTYDVNQFNSDGLFNGKLGLVYYYFTLYGFFNDEKFLNMMQRYLCEIFKNIEEYKSSILYDSTLGEGLSGFGFVLNLLTKKGVLNNCFEDQIEEINNIVYDEAVKLLSSENYDYVNGPFGMLFYLNEVQSENHVDKIMKILTDRFEEESSFLFYNNYSYIEGIHIGYAHGICGIIKVLSQIQDTRADSIVRILLENILKLIKSSNFYKDGAKYYLPRSIHCEKNKNFLLNYRAVLAWSNSDINFSTLVYSLPEKFSTKELVHFANEIANESFKKKEEKKTRVWDHRFYFGSSGILKTYNYLYGKTNDELYRKASEFWYRKTKYLLKKNNIEDYHKLSFLNNLPATTLSVLEYEENIDLDWTKPFLL